MPSYIELDKEGSFPPSSNVGKVIFGIDINGNAALTNENGETTPIGSGGGTGLYIPKPIIYASSSVGSIIDHTYNQPISQIGDGSGLPGAIQNSWDSSGLKLTYDTTDDTFLNYNPRYFLFTYIGNKKLSKASQNNPNTRINNEKFGKYFSHPPSFIGGLNVSTYKNFSGSGILDGTYEPSFTSFTSEWDLIPGKGKVTPLNDFNPLRFYFSSLNGGTSELRGQEFFPIRIDDCVGSIGNNVVSVTTVNGYKNYADPHIGPPITYVKPRVNLHIKFAIVIDDPNNVGRYLIGPMSDTMRIYPKEGYFYDDIDTSETFKYYYTWSWKFE